jgi:ABC-2 type transport system permease protein
MHKILLIIEREYLSRVRKKAFIIMTLLGPLLFAGITVIPAWLASRDSSLTTVSVIDQSGLFEGKLKSNAETTFQFVKTEIDKEKKINSYNDPTFSSCKNYDIIKMVNDKLISQTNPKITDKFSMKKLILNTNKLSNPTRTNYPFKNITKKDNSSLLKFDTLKTLDIDFKINSHRIKLSTFIY